MGWWWVSVLCAAVYAEPASEMPNKRRLAGCTCTNPSYACYATYQGTLSCWSMAQSLCEDTLSGQYCTREPCQVSNCGSCSPDGTTCYTCNAGFVGPACESEAAFFSDVTATVQQSGVVAMASPKLHALLAAGFAGTSNRMAAVQYVVQAFTRLFQDSFRLVLVYPSSPMSSSVSHQQYASGAGIGGTSYLQGTICGGNPSAGGWKAVLHELAHNYIRPQTVLPNNAFYSHWGYASLGGAHKGMLGGYPRSAMTCASPAGRVVSRANGARGGCDTDVARFLATAGATQTSNDWSNRDSGFAGVERYMMGLLSAAEYRALGEDLAYCPVLDKNEGATYDAGNSVITVPCDGVGGIQFVTPDGVIEAWAAYQEAAAGAGNGLAPGARVRAAVVLLYPGPSAIRGGGAGGGGGGSANSSAGPATGASDHEAWADTYFNTSLPPVFSAATGGRASLSFAVGAADRRAPTPAPAATNPPAVADPPSAALGAYTAEVRATVTLGGLTEHRFAQLAVQAAVVAALATSFGVAPIQITLGAATFSAARRLAASVAASATVVATVKLPPANLVAAAARIAATPPALLAAALAQAFTAAGVAGMPALTVAPIVAVAAPTPAPAPPAPDADAASDAGMTALAVMLVLVFAGGTCAVVLRAYRQHQHQEGEGTATSHVGLDSAKAIGPQHQSATAIVSTARVAEGVTV